MKSLDIYISEKFRVSKEMINTSDLIIVKSKKQLRDIIYDRLDENPEELNLNDIDVSLIEDFSNIFSSYFYQALRKTKKIYIENWNTKNANNMGGMFQACWELEEVDVSNFDVFNVTDMEYMFRKCKSLKKLDLTNWKVNKVKNMIKIFFGCENLETIGDISTWEPEELKLFDNAFNGCKNLKNVDISKWSDYFLNNVSSSNAFDDCPGITIPKWAK